MQKLLIGHQLSEAWKFAKKNNIKYFTFVSSPEHLYGIRNLDGVLMHDANLNPRISAIVAQSKQQKISLVEAAP